MLLLKGQQKYWALADVKKHKRKNLKGKKWTIPSGHMMFIQRRCKVMIIRWGDVV